MSSAHELLSQLVAIDSVNPDLVAGAAGEAEISRFVAGWLREAGLEVTLQEVVPGRPNVIGRVRGTGGGRSLLLNAHMDTVGVAGMAEPHAPWTRDGRLYGRGALDMKGGLAAMLLTAEQIARQPLPGDLIVAAVVDEEYASIGTSALVTNWHADAAIVTEPTDLQICVAHKGFVWVDITASGVAAHGSRPDLGVDAIAKMGHVLVGLEGLDQILRASPGHPLLGTGSLHASLIEGGQERSSYPAACRLAVERRTVPGETTAQVVEQMQAILDRRTAADPATRATLELVMERPSFAISPDAPIVTTLQASIQSIAGVAAELVGAPFWMDSAILSAAGVPTVIFGPRGTGAHAEVEWVELASVERCAGVLTATARRFCT